MINTKTKEAIERLQEKPYHYSENEIKEMILKSNIAVERGIVAIWKRQTLEEKRTKSVRNYNKVGFSAFHVKRGSYYAGWINRGNHLTGKHIELGRNLILHYVTQLTKISNKEEA
jgi:hypothetical protein